MKPRNFCERTYFTKLEMRTAMGEPLCWVMTTGQAGTRAQACGLAEQIGVPFIEKTVDLKAPWRWLPGHIALGALRALDSQSDLLQPPWPRLLISCGRRSVALAIALKRKCGRNLTSVHIQNPGVSPRYFDLVIAPIHDRIEGGNVYKTLGALHGVTQKKLAGAEQTYRSFFAQQDRPLISVLIGGNSKAHLLTDQLAESIGQQLVELCQQGYGMLVTFSRRTGVTGESIIRRCLQGTKAFVWDGQEPNPYLGILAVADVILVTGDSVSMVSEATATGKPVMIIDLEGGSKKFTAFHHMMYEAGLTRPFLGRIEHWSYQALDETEHIAALVKEKLYAQQA